MSYNSHIKRGQVQLCAVVEYYNRRGAPLYGAVMDMSKAFDMVSWSELFTTLRARKLNAVTLRLMIVIYQNQKCNVVWNNTPSFQFRVTNGVRQGGVISAILFAVYINELLEELRKSQLGCHIDGVFFGAFLFADDIFLLSGNIGGLQALVDICFKFAPRKNLKFGTDAKPEKSKTKCIAFSKNMKEIKNLRNVKLDGQLLPWVHHVKHLGNILQSENSMKLDIALKRGQMIGKINSLLQEFHFLDPKLILKLIMIYATSLPGSCLWNLLSPDSERVFTSWNVTIRNVFKLDRRTHRSLIEPLSEQNHLKTALFSRFLTFYKSLINCKKLSIRYLCQIVSSDKHSQMGKILTYISKSCLTAREDVESLSKTEVKRKFCYYAIDESEKWREIVARELLQARQNKQLEIPGFDNAEIETLFNFICTN